MLSGMAFQHVEEAQMCNLSKLSKLVLHFFAMVYRHGYGTWVLRNIDIKIRQFLKYQQTICWGYGKNC